MTISVWVKGGRRKGKETKKEEKKGGKKGRGKKRRTKLVVRRNYARIEKEKLDLNKEERRGGGKEEVAIQEAK